MDAQLLAVFAIIGLALAYLVRAWLSPKSGCASGCGKCAAPVAEVSNPRRIGLPVVRSTS